MKKIVPCGCGKHYVHDNKFVVRWLDKVWDARCAFNASLEMMDKNKLIKFIGSVECTMCGKAVGKKFQIEGEQIYHPNCLYDIGGGG